MNLSSYYWYYFVFVWLIAAGIGLPVPEEIPVVTGGVLVGHRENELRWWIMLPVCIAGVVISDGLLYGIGRAWGPRLLRYRWIRTRILPPERLDRIEDNFRHYGVTILLFARFLPAIRSPIFITAGIMRVPFSRFLLADGLYAIPGVSLLFFLGCWFTDQFMDVIGRLENYRPFIVVVVLAAVASYLVYHFLHQPMAMGDPKELPVLGQVAAKMSDDHMAHRSHDSSATLRGPSASPLENGQSNHDSNHSASRPESPTRTEE